MHYKYQIDTTLQNESNPLEQGGRFSHNTNNDTISKVEQQGAPQDSIKSYGINNINAIPTRKSNQVNKSVDAQQPKLYEPLPHNKNIYAWQTIVLFSLVVLVATSKAFNQSRFKQLLKSIFNYSVAQEVIREEKVFFHRANLWLTLVHLLSISLLFYHFIKPAVIDQGEIGLTMFYLIVGFITIAYLIKYVSAKALFFAFGYGELSSEYVFNISVYNNLLGITLIPVLMILYFTGIDMLSALKNIIVPIVLFTYVLRLIRMFVAGNNYGISYFYIFLYICTLEILPLVVLYKVFVL